MVRPDRFLPRTKFFVTDLAQSIETAEQNTNDLQSSRCEPRTKPDDFYYTPRAVTQSRNQRRFVCYLCGGNHKAPDCRFKDATCNSCGKKGQLLKVCRSVPATAETAKSRKHQHRDNLRSAVATTKDSKATKTHHLDACVDEYNLFTVTSSSNQPLMASLTLNGANLIMEIDTGAARSIISDKTFTQL